MRASLSRYVALAVGVTALSACTVPQGQPTVTQNATASLTKTLEGDTLSGTYDPRGFTELSIKDLLKFDCPTQRLASYSETPGPRTLITFTATCAV